MSMPKCNDCSCELSQTTKFYMTPLQKVYMCKRTKTPIITLTELIIYGGLFSFIYYKYQTNSLNKVYNYNKK